MAYQLLKEGDKPGRGAGVPAVVGEGIENETDQGAVRVVDGGGGRGRGGDREAVARVLGAREKCGEGGGAKGTGGEEALVVNAARKREKPTRATASQDPCCGHDGDISPQEETGVGASPEFVVPVGNNQDSGAGPGPTVVDTVQAAPTMLECQCGRGGLQYAPNSQPRQRRGTEEVVRSGWRQSRRRRVRQRGREMREAGKATSGEGTG